MCFPFRVKRPRLPTPTPGPSVIQDILFLRNLAACILGIPGPRLLSPGPYRMLGHWGGRGGARLITLLCAKLCRGWGEGCREAGPAGQYCVLPAVRSPPRSSTETPDRAWHSQPVTRAAGSWSGLQNLRDHIVFTPLGAKAQSCQSVDQGVPVWPPVLGKAAAHCSLLEGSVTLSPSLSLLLLCEHEVSLRLWGDLPSFPFDHSVHSLLAPCEHVVGVTWALLQSQDPTVPRSGPTPSHLPVPMPLLCGLHCHGELASLGLGSVGGQQWGCALKRGQGTGPGDL